MGHVNETWNRRPKPNTTTQQQQQQQQQQQERQIAGAAGGKGRGDPDERIYDSKEKLQQKQQQKLIVVDGYSAIGWAFCNHYELVLLDFEAVRERIKLLVEAFNACGYRLVCFFDGVVDGDKAATWVDRRRQQSYSIRKINLALEEHDAVCVRKLRVDTPWPVCEDATRLIPQAFKDAGCEVKFCYIEADKEACYYARKHHAEAILTTDSDMLIYPVDGVLNFNTLIVRSDLTLKCQIVRREHFLSKVQIMSGEIWKLPLWLGNDIYKGAMPRIDVKRALKCLRNANKPPSPSHITIKIKQYYTVSSCGSFHQGDSKMAAQFHRQSYFGSPPIERLSLLRTGRALPASNSPSSFSSPQPKNRQKNSSADQHYRHHRNDRHNDGRRRRRRRRPDSLASADSSAAVEDDADMDRSFMPILLALRPLRTKAYRFLGLSRVVERVCLPRGGSTNQQTASHHQETDGENYTWEEQKQEQKQEQRQEDANESKDRTKASAAAADASRNTRNTITPNPKTSAPPFGADSITTKTSTATAVVSEESKHREHQQGHHQPHNPQSLQRTLVRSKRGNEGAAAGGAGACTAGGHAKDRGFVFLDAKRFGSKKDGANSIRSMSVKWLVEAVLRVKAVKQHTSERQQRAFALQALGRGKYDAVDLSSIEINLGDLHARSVFLEAAAIIRAGYQPDAREKSTPSVETPCVFEYFHGPLFHRLCTGTADVV